MTLPFAIALLLAMLLGPVLIGWLLWLVLALVAAIPSRPAVARPVPAREDDFQDTRAVTLDILIPAHNEEILLPRLLETLRLQTAIERVGTMLVVADHCTDHTLAATRHVPLERLHVLERNEGPRGKPAALRDGLAWLSARSQNSSSPRAVLILDADCTVSPNLVEQTVFALDRGAQVTQAAYILDEARRTSGARLHSAAALAFALKNFIRPRGMARLGLPCQLFGTGMAFRTEVLKKITFADHLAEDLAISYDLLRSGILAQFLPGALVRSPLPEQRSAMTTQKLRWETGQLHTWTKLPAILRHLLSRRPHGWLRSAVSVVDWSAPPLAMAVLYWLGVAFASAVLVLGGWSDRWILGLGGLAIACLVAYVLIGGVQYSGITSVARLFISLPWFLMWKIALYARMLAGRAPRSWQRTPRTATPPASPSAVAEVAVPSALQPK